MAKMPQHVNRGEQPLRWPSHETYPHHLVGAEVHASARLLESTGGIPPDTIARFHPESLQSGKAQYEDKALAQRVKDLEDTLQSVTGGAAAVGLTGANRRLVNDLGPREGFPRAQRAGRHKSPLLGCLPF